MRLNEDFSAPIIIHASSQEWVASPAPGVERRMLFRIGDEKARATSIVRYAPGSRFDPHVHTGGEEFLVLEGTFQDEDGDYPPGSYVRNPPGTSHAPAAAEGATIFVRLWQFRAGDRAHIVRHPCEGRWVAPREGAKSSIRLFADDHEEVRIEEWHPSASIVVENSEGLEFLVIAGSLEVNGEILSPQAWGRFPKGTDLRARAGDNGARVWLRLAPLMHADVCRF